jgi:hypothetical protein
MPLKGELLPFWFTGLPHGRRQDYPKGWQQQFCIKADWKWQKKY